MNIRRKGAGIAFTATLLIALVATVAAPNAFASGPNPLLSAPAGFPILDAFAVSLLIASVVASITYFALFVASAFWATGRLAGQLLMRFLNRNNSSSTTNRAGLLRRRLFGQLVAFVTSLRCSIVRQFTSMSNTVNTFVSNSPSQANMNSIIGTFTAQFGVFFTIFAITTLTLFGAIPTSVVVVALALVVATSVSMRSPSLAGIQRSQFAKTLWALSTSIHWPRGRLVLADASHISGFMGQSTTLDVDATSPFGEQSAVRTSPIGQIYARWTQSANKRSEIRE